jgi:hypothetical protein
MIVLFKEGSKEGMNEGRKEGRKGSIPNPYFKFNFLSFLLIYCKL